MLSFSFVAPVAPSCGAQRRGFPSDADVDTGAGWSLVDRLRSSSLLSALGLGGLGDPPCEGADLTGPDVTLRLHAALLSSSPGAAPGSSSSLAVVATTSPVAVSLRTGIPAAMSGAASARAPAPARARARRSAAATSNSSSTTASSDMGAMAMSGGMRSAFSTDGWGWGPFMFPQVQITSGGELAAAIILSAVFGAFSTATVVAGKRLESVGANPAAGFGWVGVGFLSTAVRTGAHYVAMLLVRACITHALPTLTHALESQGPVLPLSSAEPLAHDAQIDCPPAPR